MKCYFKNVILLLILAISSQFYAASKAETITISPIKTISTASDKIQEGDTIYFQVEEGAGNIKEGEKVTGVITNYEPNGFLGQNAVLIIENFKVEKTNEKLDGIIYCSGNEHNQVMEFLSDSTINPIIRGGEVKILPKETFSFETQNNSNKLISSKKTAIKIIPDQKIATTYNQIEVGDIVRFKVLNDIYQNNQLFIEKDTPVIGIVDHLEDNGWHHDNAEITFKKFKTKDVNSNIITINSEVKINGFNELKNLYPKKERFFQYIGLIWRGKEIDIDPLTDTNKYNLWL